MDEKFIELAQRVASLEEFAKQSAQDRAQIRDSVEKVKATAEKTNANIAIIKEKLTRWEGRFGGIIFAVGCLWAFMSGVGKMLLDWVKLLGPGSG